MLRRRQDYGGATGAVDAYGGDGLFWSVVDFWPELAGNPAPAESVSMLAPASSALPQPQSLTTYGTSGDDVITGDALGNRIEGGEGNDTLSGLDGDDILFGDAGSDTLNGGDGNDYLSAGSDMYVVEADYLYGGAGNDYLAADSDGDLLDGGSGDDTLTGATGEQHLLGGDGNDKLWGYKGDDLLEGGEGSDTYTIALNAGWETIVETDAEAGTAGQDSDLLRLHPAHDLDVLRMRRDGDDLLVMIGDGTDGATIKNWFIDDGARLEGLLYAKENRVISGAEFDALVDSLLNVTILTTPDGLGNIIGTDDSDTIHAASQAVIYAEAGADVVHGSASDDDIYGGDGGDWLHGEAGNDVIFGEAGDDRIHGEAGIDTLMGETGDDEMHGGAGNDVLDTGEGDDTAYGGADDDDIQGQEGNDWLHGDAGDDTISGGDGNDDISGGDGNDYITGDQGFDSLDGDAGDDVILAGDQGSMIRGGQGDDTLYGGDGIDTYLYARGDGHDTIDAYGSSGVDGLAFTDGITLSDLGFSMVGDDLLITITGTDAGSVTLKNWGLGERAVRYVTGNGISLDTDDLSSLSSFSGGMFRPILCWTPDYLQQEMAGFSAQSGGLGGSLPLDGGLDLTDPLAPPVS